jgi:magnesium-transporting ATPase (P-type)
MQDSSEYKVIDRRKFAAVMVVLVGIVSVGVWLSLDCLAEYTNQLQKLSEEEPLKAAEAFTQLMRSFAILNGMVLSSFATIVIWHGWRSWRTASIPPRGSWILEGQQTWTGESAERIARFTMVAGVLLAVMAVASSLFLWGIGDTFPGQRR